MEAFKNAESTRFCGFKRLVNVVQNKTFVIDLGLQVDYPISEEKVNSHEVPRYFNLQKLICMEHSTYISMSNLILSFLFL